MQNEVIDVESSVILTAEEKAALKEELNHPNFKKWFAGLLHETTVNVKFFKVNGELREMSCTLREDLIPADKQPKGTTTKKAPTDTIAVFDTEKQEWRSFRYDSLEEFTWELGEEQEYPATPEPVLLEEENENE